MQKTRGAALLAATALAVGGLAACGDEGEPGEASSTASPSAVGGESSSDSTSSSGSSSSGADGDREVAELPEAAQKKTRAGAIAFNEFYQQQLGEALKSGSTTTLKKYTNDCDVCENFIQKTEDNDAEGITMDRNPYSAHNLSATARDDGGMKVTLKVKSSGYHEVLADGSKGRSADETSYTLVTDTQWHEGHWVIHDSVITK